jgi:enoyl-CoA hydratase/carnithine racemase
VSAILALTVENSIATLVLDRPAVGNTIDMSLARALVDATVRCDEDEAIRCVVLRRTRPRGNADWAMTSSSAASPSARI